MADYVPLSVRHGSLRKRVGWAILGLRERVALWLAPWLYQDEVQPLHPDDELAAREHREFIEANGYQPGYHYENGMLWLVPLENNGVVPSEATKSPSPPSNPPA